MRTPPEHDRALLYADTVALRDCAARLDALSEDGLPPAQCGAGWNEVLSALAERCRVAAAELERASAAFFAGSGEGEPTADPGAGVRSLAPALAFAERLLGGPHTAARPLAPLIRRLPGGRR